ncbi:hypothetical protein ACFGVS_15160 [Mucilaginibacter sp. AW1-7]|uniref:phosphorylase family protein n=1 Tax=Mucilaginibacter sp. AW1-7 TaxID=3349874 RepID=UPI003F73B605
MINILVIDDDKKKVGKISDFLNTIPNCIFEVAPDLVSARRLLQERFALAIIDMNLPERFSDDPKESAGMDFILEIKKSKRLKLPEHIIGLTELTNFNEKYKSILEENLVSLIKYDSSAINWQTTIKVKIEEISAQKAGEMAEKSYGCDVAFVTALLTPELEAVLKLPYNWEKLKIPNDSANYSIGKLMLDDGRAMNIAATHLPQMGMVATATACTKLIEHFRPRYMIMTGICGGVEGKVNLGDIIISDMSYDLDSGKLSDKDGQPVFEPDYRSIQLDAGLKNALMGLTTDKNILREIKDQWQGDAQSAELKLHIGPMGSGAAVISHAGYIEEKMKYQRKLIAIDMETYAVFYAAQHSTDPKPTALSIKCISDHANAHKNDNVQKYGSFISAKTADHVIRNVIAHMLN